MKRDALEELLAVGDDIVGEWRRVRALLEPRIEEVARATAEAGVVDVASYLVRGGKRFRGFLVVVIAEALGARAEEALDAAVAIELVHSASLAIDDIIDGDTERRGSRVAWLVYGVPKTVLASLLMIPVAQRLTEKYGFRAIMHVTRAWEATVRGEIIDVFLAGTLSPRRYPELARLKTGSLFKLAGILGALAAGRRDIIPAMEEYGEKLGLAYQLADDTADYKLYLDGLRPRLDPSERLFERWAREVLGAREPREVVDKALNEIRLTVEAAARAAEALPDTGRKRLLKALPVFMAEKMLEEAGITLLPVRS